MSGIEEDYDEVIKIADFEFTLFRNPQYDWEIFYNNEKSTSKIFETKRKAKNFLKEWYSPKPMTHVKYL